MLHEYDCIKMINVTTICHLKVILVVAFSQSYDRILKKKNYTANKDRKSFDNKHPHSTIENTADV